MIIFFLILSVFAAKCPDGKSYDVAITFDDGPHAANTSKVLAALKTKRTPGTFFVLGSNFEGSKKTGSYNTLQQILDEGHTIGSHTYSHIAHTKVPLAKAKQNIDKATEAFGEYVTSILRLPYGDGSSFNDDLDGANATKPVIKLVNKAGFRHVGWDIDTRDWHPQDRLKLPGRMLEQICARKGGVILFHDIQTNTANKIGNWIDAIHDSGHKIVKLSEIKNREGKIKYPESLKCHSSDEDTPCKKSQSKKDKPNEETNPDEELTGIEVEV